MRQTQQLSAVPHQDAPEAVCSINSRTALIKGSRMVSPLLVLADLPALGLAAVRTTRPSRTKTLDARSGLIFLLQVQIYPMQLDRLQAEQADSEKKTVEGARNVHF